MLIANFERNFDYNKFFPSHKSTLLEYNNTTRASQAIASIYKQIEGHNSVAIIGTKTLCNYYGTDYYDNSDVIDLYETYLFDVAREKGLPIIGINRGYNLLASKLGIDVRSCSDENRHLNFYKNNVYAVNSYHGTVYRSNGYTNDVINEKGYSESIYYSGYKCFGVAWNPELDCPASGIDLFDTLLEKYLGLKR